MEFQKIITTLQDFWQINNCNILTPVDMKVGAATFHPATFFGLLDLETKSFAYVQPCRRPSDGRYGFMSDRLQYYHQFQVILQPANNNILDLYLESLKAIGLNTEEHDIKFIKDDWNSPTLAAFGSGWEVSLNGVEVSQITYFDSIGNIPCQNATCEIAYGLERIAVILQNISSFNDLKYSHSHLYSDIYLKNEEETSLFNYKHTDIELLKTQLLQEQNECKRLIDLNLVRVAYESIINMNHLFNLLDTRGVLAVNEKRKIILSIRDLSVLIAHKYIASDI